MRKFFIARYLKLFGISVGISEYISVCEFFRKNIRLFVVDFSFYVEFIFGTANDFIFDPVGFPVFFQLEFYLGFAVFFRFYIALITFCVYILNNTKKIRHRKVQDLYHGQKKDKTYPLFNDAPYGGIILTNSLFGRNTTII